jgi:hypothetical protein
MSDAELGSRLATLEADAPASELGSGWKSRRGRRSPIPSLAGAVILSLAVAGVALAGTVWSGALVLPWTTDRLPANFHPAAENPGQPLAGANLECMAPRQAADYLAAHGFAKVVWEVDRDATTPGGQQQQPEVRQSTPPEHGYVIPGAIVDGTLTIVIDQRAAARGAGTCAGAPMP